MSVETVVKEGLKVPLFLIGTNNLSNEFYFIYGGLTEDGESSVISFRYTNTENRDIEDVLPGLLAEYQVDDFDFNRHSKGMITFSLTRGSDNRSCPTQVMLYNGDIRSIELCGESMIVVEMIDEDGDFILHNFNLKSNDLYHFRSSEDLSAMLNLAQAE